MPDNLSPTGNSYKMRGGESEKIALAILRLGLGTMFLSVFVENFNKGLYSKDGYTGLINYYLEKGHAPALWKNIMGLAASHATVAGPMQAVTEVSFGAFLVVGLLTRPVALAAFLFLTSLWVSEWGTAWIWELLIPMIAAFSLMVGGAGRKWGIDAKLMKKYPRIPLW